jgi:outer membrane protein assembly factor BamB
MAVNPATGAALWQTRYTGTPDSGFSDVAVSPDGSMVFASGTSEPTRGPFNALTVAFNATTGAILWTAGLGTLSPVDGLAVSLGGTAVFVWF